jgi:DNA uptake protein ComE-like DNA-binding protein
MKFHSSGSLSAAAAIAVITGGLTGCASTQEQQAGKSGTKETQAKQTAPKKKAENKIKLGESVEVSGTTKVQTPKTETRVETRSIPTIEERTVKADINKMSVADFVALGLEKEVANEVVRYRMQTGPFHYVEDLENVPGMDTAWLDRIGDRLAAG